MRKVIVARGAPGVGKSKLAARLGLSGHTLGSDQIRLLLGGAEIGPDGDWGISQDRAERVWGMFHSLAAERMERGETLYLDATFARESDLEPVFKKAAELGYKGLIADFSGAPVEAAIAGNATREALKKVKETTIRAIDEDLKASAGIKLPEGWSRASWAQGEFEGIERAAREWLIEPELDFSGYARVIHIGDLQGCLDPIKTLIEKDGGWREDTRYIFVGDLLDRGAQNGELMSWLLPNLMRSNVDLVWGNHEDHLERWAKGLEARSREFRFRTQPQLEAAGVDKERVSAALKKARELLVYRKDGVRVVCSHAGLPGLPPMIDGKLAWHLISMAQLKRGGQYSDPIDEIWAKGVFESEGIWQVHGHRNLKGLPPLAAPGSWNLEDRVEFGGVQRAVVLEQGEWTVKLERNESFIPLRERVGRVKRRKNDGGPISETERSQTEEMELLMLADGLPIPEWVEQGASRVRLDPAMLQALRSHEGVLEKKMKDRPHVSSLNFTRDVFFDKKWDEVVVKARGLFIDEQTGEVVSRGYEKFFNVEERPETSMAALKANLKFPIVCHVKENGYLGNMGYDARSGELFIASKSSSTGDFADWFKEIVERDLNEATRERIRRWLRDAEASLVFEVIDPVRDPHMIEYERSKLVLLDAFHRSDSGAKLPYEQLKKLGEHLGLEVKRRAFEFKTWEAFEGWLAKARKDLSWRLKGEDIEGVVIEDQEGFHTKVKLPHYAFWKSMRTQKDRLARLLRKKEQMSAPGQKMSDQAQKNWEADWARAQSSDDHPLAISFMRWCAGRPVDELESSSIIELRSAYQKDPASGWNESLLSHRWTKFDPTEGEKEQALKAAAKGKAIEEDSDGERRPKMRR